LTTTAVHMQSACKKGITALQAASYENQMLHAWRGRACAMGTVLRLSRRTPDHQGAHSGYPGNSYWEGGARLPAL